MWGCYDEGTAERRSSYLDLQTITACRDVLMGAMLGESSPGICETWGVMRRDAAGPIGIYSRELCRLRRFTAGPLRVTGGVSQLTLCRDLMRRVAV